MQRNDMSLCSTVAMYANVYIGSHSLAQYDAKRQCCLCHSRSLANQIVWLNFKTEAQLVRRDCTQVSKCRVASRHGDQVNESNGSDDSRRHRRWH